MIRRYSLILLAIIISAVPFYGDDAAKEMDNMKWSFRQGNLLSSLKSGVNAQDQICRKLCSSLISYMPDLENYTVTATNQYYSFSAENGYVDYSAQVQKIFSNQNVEIQLNYDVSPNNVERYYNLFKSYDFLSDKGSYKKYSFKLRKVEIPYLVDANNVYLLFVFGETEGELKSGFLVKIVYSYLQIVPTIDKRKLVDETVREIAGKMNTSGIKYLLK